MVTLNLKNGLEWRKTRTSKSCLIASAGEACAAKAFQASDNILIIFRIVPDRIMVHLLTVDTRFCCDEQFWEGVAVLGAEVRSSTIKANSLFFVAYSRGIRLDKILLLSTNHGGMDPV